MRLVQIRAVPGQAVVLEDLDAGGWPFIVTVGGVRVTAWPEKYRAGRTEIRARLRFKVPELGGGSHQIIVTDKNGPTVAGNVTI